MMSRFTGWLLLLLALSAACQGGGEKEVPASATSPAVTANVSQPTSVAAPATETTVELVAPDPSATPANTATPMPRPENGRMANADVVHVRAVQAADGSWTFHVTVEHPDTGWEDYADGWNVVTPGGDVVKREPEDPFTRLLLHPHVDEQPFTRSQSGLALPAGVTEVTVRAHDLVDGFGGGEVVVDLTKPSGPGFEVEREEG